MRLSCVLLFLVITVVARAAEWRNDSFGVSANLPDATGWQPMEAPSTPAVTVLAAMQHPQKQAVFGINVLHDLPTSNLRDPATIAAVEQSLRSLGYQFIGRSTVNLAGREWIQFPVRSANPPMTGIIRYTSANDQVYVVSLLRGGGQEAAQDPELQAASMSVRIGVAQPASAIAATSPSAPPLVPVPSDSAPAPASSSASSEPSAASGEKSEEATKDGEPGPVKIGPFTITQQQARIGIYALAGLIVLAILLRIISPKKDSH